MRPSRQRRPEAADDPHAAERQAAALLARREHARAELRRKLLDRGFEPEAVDAALDHLTEQGLLSDERFVEGYVRARVERGFGPRRIEVELRERECDPALIEAHLEPRDPAWIARLEEVRRKRFGEARPEAIRERARQSRFLEQRGFTGEQIRRALADDD